MAPQTTTPSLVEYTSFPTPQFGRTSPKKDANVANTLTPELPSKPSSRSRLTYPVTPQTTTPSPVEYTSFPTPQFGRTSPNEDAAVANVLTLELPSVPPSRSSLTYPVMRRAWTYSATGSTQIEQIHDLADGGAILVTEKVTVYSLDRTKVCCKTVIKSSGFPHLQSNLLTQTHPQPTPNTPLMGPLNPSYINDIVEDSLESFFEASGVPT